MHGLGNCGNRLIERPIERADSEGSPWQMRSPEFGPKDLQHLSIHDYYSFDQSVMAEEGFQAASFPEFDEEALRTPSDHLFEFREWCQGRLAKLSMRVEDYDRFGQITWNLLHEQDTANYEWWRQLDDLLKNPEYAHLRVHWVVNGSMIFDAVEFVDNPLLTFPIMVCAYLHLIPEHMFGVFDALWNRIPELSRMMVAGCARGLNRACEREFRALWKVSLQKLQVRQQGLTSQEALEQELPSPLPLEQESIVLEDFLDDEFLDILQEWEHQITADQQASQLQHQKSPDEQALQLDLERDLEQRVGALQQDPEHIIKPCLRALPQKTARQQIQWRHITYESILEDRRERKRVCNARFRAKKKLEKEQARKDAGGESSI